MVAVEVEDKPGGLSRDWRRWTPPPSTLNTCTPTCADPGEAVVICKIDEREKALTALAGRGVPTLTAEALKTL